MGRAVWRKFIKGNFIMQSDVTEEALRGGSIRAWREDESTLNSLMFLQIVLQLSKRTLKLSIRSFITLNELLQSCLEKF